MIGRLLELDQLDEKSMAQIMLDPRLLPLVKNERRLQLLIMGQRSGRSMGGFFLTDEESAYESIIKTVLVREVFQAQTGALWSVYESPSLGRKQMRAWKAMVEALEKTNINHLYSLWLKVTK